MKDKKIKDSLDENKIKEEVITKIAPIAKQVNGRAVHKDVTVKRGPGRPRKYGAKTASALEKLKYHYIKKQYKIFLKPKISWWRILNYICE